jgi:hypothetical protein
MEFGIAMLGLANQSLRIVDAEAGEG